MVEAGRIRDARRRLDPVRVVEDHPEVADPSHAGLRTHRRLPALDPRVAERALLGLPRGPVEVDLLVRAAGDAHPPAPALLLVDEHDPVFLALVDRPGGAGGHARGVETVLAQARQVHHEGVLELAVDLPLESGEVGVPGALGELPAEDLLPVRPAFDLLHALAGQERAGPRGRRGIALRGALEVLVVEGEGLVVVVDLGKVRVAEELREDRELAPHLRLDLPPAGPLPSSIPALLVLPVVGVAGPRLGLDVVEPGVLHALPVRPHVLAGHRAGMAADALVEVEHLADLGPNLHRAASSVAGIAGGGSSQSTRSIFRTITNSSRFEPTVP